MREGRSPAIGKRREKRRLKEARSFGEFAGKWFEKAPMADSTRDMRRSIWDRELEPRWKNRLLTEISPDDPRGLCGRIVDGGAPATATIDAWARGESRAPVIAPPAISLRLLDPAL